MITCRPTAEGAERPYAAHEAPLLVPNLAPPLLGSSHARQLQRTPEAMGHSEVRPSTLFQ
jgi:hypothetical protein